MTKRTVEAMRMKHGSVGPYREVSDYTKRYSNKLRRADLAREQREMEDA